jgi:hypothetical protein
VSLFFSKSKKRPNIAPGQYEQHTKEWGADDTYQIPDMLEEEKNQ